MNSMLPWPFKSTLSPTVYSSCSDDSPGEDDASDSKHWALISLKALRKFIHVSLTPRGS